LFYFDGLSYQQISDFLDVPITTVESRLHKARKQLKKEMFEMAKEMFGKRKPKGEFKLKEVSGFLKIIPYPGYEPGYGFLKHTVDAIPSADDIYVPPAQIRRYGLQEGDFIEGEARSPRKTRERQEHYHALLKIEKVNRKPL